MDGTVIAMNVSIITREAITNRFMWRVTSTPVVETMARRSTTTDHRVDVIWLNISTLDCTNGVIHSTTKPNPSPRVQTIGQNTPITPSKELARRWRYVLSRFSLIVNLT